MNDERLDYPSRIAPLVGIGLTRLCAFRHRGLKFFGRKTSVKWVREFLDKETNPTPEAEPSNGQGAHLQHQAGNISDGQV